jgi:hypothetical protein
VRVVHSTACLCMTMLCASSLLRHLRARSIALRVLTAHMPCREERGVKVRLEIGPKDAEQSICTIARSQRRPGLVAYKQPGNVDKTLASQVQVMLNIPDRKVPAGDYSKYEAKQKQHHKAEADADAEEAEELEDAAVAEKAIPEEAAAAGAAASHGGCTC